MKRVQVPEFGDIGFEVGEGLFSGAIALVTGDGHPYTPSHVFLVGPGQTVFEAWLLARTQPLAKYDEYIKRGRIMLFRPDAPPEAKERAYAWVVSTYTGAPYGIPQLLGHLAVEAGRGAGLDVANPGQAGVVCHEIGVRYLQRLNFEAHLMGAHTDCEWADPLRAEQETPERLRDYCAGTREVA